ncbi:MAG TPA: Sua5/YciO/YrdC/YwlC family protein, partial [Atopostipes sp.]|nr:Sua5/YciO/YrdC/YwlC family protein [Atopostipes sp.]
MKTKQFTEKEIKQAVDLIQAGELVAFPTDTVYGLGADATNEAAVEKVFTAKGRPKNRPINVLISQPEDILNYTKNTTDEAMALA